MNRITLWIAGSAALIAVQAFAQVSPAYRDWGNGAARYLMMRQERTDWAALKTDAEAKAFVDLFWARRDPTPDTPVNEQRQQFEARVAEADKNYRDTKKPGSQTDRGLVYVLLGKPSQIVNEILPPRAPEGSAGVFARPIHLESWIYRNTAAEQAVGTKSFDVIFDFQDDKAGGEFELDGMSQKSFESIALALAKSMVKRPFMTAAELASGGESGRAVPLRMIVVGDEATARDVLRQAQEGQDFAGLAQKYSAHSSAKQGGYMGRMPFAELADDFKAAFAGKEPGATVLIARSPLFAVVRLLTEAEAAAADAELAKPK